MASDIFDAIQTGDFHRLRELAPAGEASARNDEGVSALMFARYLGREDIADELRPYAGELDVFEAATFGDIARLRALLDADPGLAQARSADGFTALHFAVFFGPLEAAKLLVERGADIEAVATGSIPVRPLHSAATARKREAAELLLDAGADVNAVAEGGFTPIHSAAQNGDAGLVRLLLDRGADPTIATDDGRTAVELAGDNEEVAALLG